MKLYDVIFQQSRAKSSAIARLLETHYERFVQLYQERMARDYLDREQVQKELYVILKIFLGGIKMPCKNVVEIKQIIWDIYQMGGAVNALEYLMSA